MKYYEYKSIAYGLILFSIIDIAYGLHLGFRETFFEFCNIAPLLIAYGILYKKRYFIHYVAFFSILFQMPWTLDWIALYFDLSFLNLYQSYSSVPSSFMVLSFVQHLLTAPIAIYLLLKEGKSQEDTKKSLTRPLIFTFFLAFVSYQFMYVENANCMRYTCISSWATVLNGDLYTALWTALLLLTWTGYWYFILR